jgi:ribosomal protein S18 acetylase RimI-like enzyme
MPSKTQSDLELTSPIELPIRKTLPNGAIAELDRMRPEEIEAVRSLLNYFVTSPGTEGLTYPHAQPLSPPEFAAYWLSRDAFVVRAVGNAQSPASEDRSPKDTSPKDISLTNTSPNLSPNSASPSTPALGEILGAFYLKPNFPGWCSHICNAGFIVQPAMRGQGIGRWMAETMLAIAPTQGYTAVMFNLVFATNEPSLNLWRSLGFSTIGRVPGAARPPDGSSVDAIMLHRAL